MLVVDHDAAMVDAQRAAAEADEDLAAHIESGKLQFKVASGDGLDVLEQSEYDSVVDFGAIDRLLEAGDSEGASQFVDAAHRAVRLGNPMVGLSMVPKDDYTALFEGNVSSGNVADRG